MLSCSFYRTSGTIWSEPPRRSLTSPWEPAQVALNSANLTKLSQMFLESTDHIWLALDSMMTTQSFPERLLQPKTRARPLTSATWTWVSRRLQVSFLNERVQIYQWPILWRMWTKYSLKVSAGLVVFEILASWISRFLVLTLFGQPSLNWNWFSRD